MSASNSTTEYEKSQERTNCVWYNLTLNTHTTRGTKTKREETTIRVSPKRLKDALEVVAAFVAVLGYLAYLSTYWYERGFSAHFGYPHQFIAINWTTAMNTFFIVAGYAVIAVLIALGLTWLTPWLKQSPSLQQHPSRTLALVSLVLGVITLGLVAVWVRYSFPSPWFQFWQGPRKLIWVFAAWMVLVFSSWYFLLLSLWRLSLLASGSNKGSFQEVADFVSGYNWIVLPPVNRKIFQRLDEFVKSLIEYLKKFLRRQRLTIMVVTSVLLVVWLFIWVPWKLGHIEASATTDFWITSTYPQSVVLRIYGDRLVCGTLGEDNVTLNGTFFVIGPSDNLTLKHNINIQPPG